MSITSGVPQGSVFIDPLLFLLHVKDIIYIAVGLDVNLKLFADDAKLHSSFSYHFSSSSDLIQACHNLLYGLKLSSYKSLKNKCFLFRVSNRDCHIEHTNDCKSPYVLDNNLLSWSKNTRQLGITLDSKLTFNLHISFIVHKAHIRARLILRSFTMREFITFMYVRCLNTAHRFGARIPYGKLVQLRLCNVDLQSQSMVCHHCSTLNV